MSSEVAQSVATSSTPVSPSSGNTKFGKAILITAILGLSIYGAYRWYTNYQEKKDKEFG